MRYRCPTKTPITPAKLLEDTLALLDDGHTVTMRGIRAVRDVSRDDVRKLFRDIKAYHRTAILVDGYENASITF